jgi:Fumarylacetoacetate (FAA) hydrolase family
MRWSWRFVSQASTLESGDLIISGIPAGVGALRNPPVWLALGDAITIENRRARVDHEPVVAPDRASFVIRSSWTASDGGGVSHRPSGRTAGREAFELDEKGCRCRHSCPEVGDMQPFARGVLGSDQGISDD